jgi:integrase
MRFATPLMDQLGAPFKVRQQRLGHSDVTLTLDTYTHRIGEDELRLAVQLDGILRPNAPKKENGSEGASSKPLYLN